MESEYLNILTIDVRYKVDNNHPHCADGQLSATSSFIHRGDARKS